MMYAVVTYANMRRIRAVDRIVELCERDLAFLWLTKGQRPKRDAFGEILEEITTDSGHCSEKNPLYLKEHKISSYIKLQDHEKRSNSMIGLKKRDMKKF